MNPNFMKNVWNLQNVQVKIPIKCSGQHRVNQAMSSSVVQSSPWGKIKVADEKIAFLKEIFVTHGNMINLLVGVWLISLCWFLHWRNGLIFNFFSSLIQNVISTCALTEMPCDLGSTCLSLLSSVHLLRKISYF